MRTTASLKTTKRCLLNAVHRPLSSWKWSRSGLQERLSGSDRDSAAALWKVQSRSDGCEVPCTSWPVFPRLFPSLLLACHTKARHFLPQFVFDFTPRLPPTAPHAHPEWPAVGSAGGGAAAGPDAGGGRAGLTRLACILFLTLTN